MSGKEGTAPVVSVSSTTVRGNSTGPTGKDIGSRLSAGLATAFSDPAVRQRLGGDLRLDKIELRLPAGASQKDIEAALVKALQREIERRER